MNRIVVSAAAVIAGACAYADVEWKIYSEGYPNEYGVVSRNRTNPYAGDVVVPSEWVVDGKTLPVKEIGESAFADCKALTSVVIADSVEKVGSGVFQSCTALVSVEFGRSVDEISSVIFGDCTSLKSIKFTGAKPTQVDEYAFAYRTMTVYYPEGAEGWDSRDPYWGGATLLTYVSYTPNPPESVAALNKLIEEAPDGEEVTLKLSSTGSFDGQTVNLVVPSGKRIVLDLNGKQLVCEGLVVNGTLTVDDSVGGGAVCVPTYPSLGADGKLDFKGGGLRGTFTSSEPSGGITPADAETVEVRDGKLRLGVKVERTDSLVAPDWHPVTKESVGVAEDGTVEIVIPANVSSGFYRLKSKGL